MNENQRRRLEELSGIVNQKSYTKPEFIEYLHLSELFLNEIKLDQSDKRNKRFFEDL